MNRRIRILFTIPNFDTAGSGKVVFDMVNYIDKTQFEPHIACCHDRGAFFNQVQQLGVPIHFKNVTTPYRPFWSLPFRVLRLSRFFKSHKFDLIHSWHWSSDFTEPLAAKLAKIPFLYTKKAMGWGNKSWLWRSKLSTHIVSINKDMRSQFFKDLEYKLSEIPIGINLQEYRPLVKSYKTPQNEQLDPSDFVIVSIANLVPVKGIEILLEAVNLLKNSRIKVFIVGDDTSEYGQHLKMRFESNQIKFTGKVNDVKPYLSVADLFVIPTKDEGRKEGQPIAPLEAMLCGRIVLGSNISGIKDILEAFPSLLFNPSDVNELKDKIKFVMELKIEERRNLQKRMQTYASNKYDIKASIMKHELLYNSLLHA